MFQGDRVTHTLSTGPPPSFSFCAERTMLVADKAGVSTLWRGSPRPPWRAGGGPASRHQLRAAGLGGHPHDGWQGRKGPGPLSPTALAPRVARLLGMGQPPRPRALAPSVGFGVDTPTGSPVARPVVRPALGPGAACESPRLPEDSSSATSARNPPAVYSQDPHQAFPGGGGGGSSLPDKCFLQRSG